jgi:glycosyltransferase involved in cell wall biosynthesis
MLLSVVIVAKNEEKNIARCIESVLAHTAGLGPVEVVLADSASTDNTVTIASRYPINIISLHPQWLLSPSAGRFSGVNNTSGEYVLIIDGDMELLPGWMEKAIDFLVKNPRVVSVVGRHVDIAVFPEGICRVVNPRKPGVIGQAYKTDHVYCSSVFRRKELLDAGNFHPFLRAGEEAECSYRLILKGGELWHLPDDSVKHYAIPRRTLQESFRRLKRGFLHGIGDMFTWCFWKGYYPVVWQTCKVYLIFIFLVVCSILGLAMWHGASRGIAFFLVSLPVWFWGFMMLKKKSITDGTLSMVNITAISYAIILAFFRRIPEIHTYPTDVTWVKKVG